MPDFTFTSPEGKNYTVTGPEGSTQEQAFAVLQKQLGEQATANGNDKYGFGDVGMAAVRGVPIAGGLVERFSSPESQAQYKNFDEQHPYVSGAAKMAGGVASLALPLGIPGRVGALAARGLGLTGETVSKQVLNSALSGAAIGGADALARGTDPQEQSMIGAATGAAGPIVGRAIGAGARALTGGKSISFPGLEPAAVKATGSAGYKALEIAAVQFKPNVVPDLADDIIGTLDKAKRNARLVPQVHAIVEEMKAPIQGGVHTIEDLETTRQLLGEQAGKFSDPPTQAAATIAIKKIDAKLASLKPTELVAGDAKAADAALRKARADYALGSLGGRVQEKMTNAELRAASTNSGGNTADATRQNLRSLLTSKAQGRGLTDEDLSNVENAVRPSLAGNVLRGASNLLGGGGGLGMLHGGAVGALTAGPMGAVGVPMLGYGLRKAGEAMTKAKANKVVFDILSRSPEGQRLLAARQALLARKPLSEISNTQTILGLLGRSSPTAIDQPR